MSSRDTMARRRLFLLAVILASGAVLHTAPRIDHRPLEAWQPDRVDCLADHVRALDLYRDGRVDEAVGLVRRCPAERQLQAAASRLVEMNLSGPVGGEALLLTATALMLHTDAGLRAARDDARDWYVHFDIARRMLALVVRSRGMDSRLHPFTAARWYRATIQSLDAVLAFDVAQKVRQGSGAPPRAPQAPAPWDVDMLLAEGVTAEGAVFLLRRSESMAGGASSKFQMDRIADAVKEAKRRFELTLQADPACMEARLRLGKVLLEGNDLDAAAAHLRRVVDETPARAQEYLAALFLARISERRRAPGEAEAWYSRAVEACPACQVARLALAQILAEQGRRREARLAAEPILTQRTPDAVPDDPSFSYVRGDFEQGEQTLQELRRQVMK